MEKGKEDEKPTIFSWLEQGSRNTRINFSGLNLNDLTEVGFHEEAHHGEGWPIMTIELFILKEGKKEVGGKASFEMLGHDFHVMGDIKFLNALRCLEVDRSSGRPIIDPKSFLTCCFNWIIAKNGLPAFMMEFENLSMIEGERKAQKKIRDAIGID